MRLIISLGTSLGADNPTYLKGAGDSAVMMVAIGWASCKSLTYISRLIQLLMCLFHVPPPRAVNMLQLARGLFCMSTGTGKT